MSLSMPKTARTLTVLSGIASKCSAWRAFGSAPLMDD
jgi:hypothetical protein